MFRATLPNLRNPRVAWYPSAGNDFRSLLFLHPEYQADCVVPPPDVFLFSDVLDYPSRSFLNTPILYEDSRTTLTVLSMKMVGTLELPQRPELVHFTERHELTNQIYLMMVKIESNSLSERIVPVYYAFCENTALADYLIRRRIKVSHLIRVCYGIAFGGSAASGAWLLNAIEPLKCEAFISDKNEHWYRAPLDWREADDFAVNNFISIPNQSNVELAEFSQKRWGGHETFWYRTTYNNHVN